MTSKLTIFIILTALYTSAAFSSCSSDSVKNSTRQTEKVSGKVLDWKAYNLGAEHAEKVIGIANDEAALQDALLDVRARITNIETKLGRQSATDYERGFTEYIRTEKDSLAKIIF
jgi:hypothetical protein